MSDTSDKPAVTVSRAKVSREFNYNGRRIADPSPGAPVDVAVRALSTTIPELANAKVEDGGKHQSGDTTVHTFNLKVAVGTKG